MTFYAFARPGISSVELPLTTIVRPNETLAPFDEGAVANN